ncbi:MAG: complex I NDUFA9 subunit family protein, partial [Rickettsiales bacterium]|nr:complex I NDUFA9 subunit family protein [Rickettsiales bacterium]
RFQPVYVGDVAAAIVACITRPDAMGQTYELGGPNVFSFREILEYVMLLTDNKRMLLPLPLGVASFIGMCGEVLPKPPLTRDQVRLLKSDNVVSTGMRTLSHLGIVPTAVEMVVPEYLGRFTRKTAA